MSRRNQARRRRNYNRRQHEVRERGGATERVADWLAPDETPGWPAHESVDERRHGDAATGDIGR